MVLPVVFDLHSNGFAILIVYTADNRYEETEMINYFCLYLDSRFISHRVTPTLVYF